MRSSSPPRVGWFVLMGITIAASAGWSPRTGRAEDKELTGVWRNRTPQRRVELTREYGGTPASEKAVDAALAWMVRHQKEDGGWDFSYRREDCDATCQHAGSMHTARNAATGLVLMALLGAGHSPNTGEHREAVRKGCDYLIAKQRNDEVRGGSLVDGGNMYSHGIAAQALCEAYGMSRDEKLKEPAKAAVKYILFAQYEHGGWRYSPKQPGDTSVTGWQLAALFAARHAQLEVPAKALESADSFLASVSKEGGTQYGYTSPGAGLATTAIGLWTRSQFPSSLKPDVRDQGLDALAKDIRAETTNNCYAGYYVSLAEFQRADDAWRNWNARTRDRLVESQETKGHANGSWDPSHESFGDQAGRLYVTALKTLTLEVYYRYPPRLRVE